MGAFPDQCLEKNNFLFFFPPNTNSGLVLLVLAHPQHRSFCLIACETSKSTLGHVPYSLAGLARPLLALRGSAVLSPGAQQGHTGSDPGPGWWLALASLTQVSPAAGTQVHGASGSGPAADIRAPPTHMHTSVGCPSARRRIRNGV